MSLIRTASFDALDPRTAYLLWQLRQRVFVVEQECPYLDLDGRDLEPATRHVWAEDGGLPVAYLRVLGEPPSGRGRSRGGDPAAQRDEAATDTPDGRSPGGTAPEGMRLGRVLVAPSHRGRGLAEELMSTALELVGGRPCHLDAQSHLVAWYRRLGFEPSGEEFVEDGIPHVPMSLVR